MELLIAIVALLASLVILNKGADWLVEGASRLAALARISPLVIGLTIVAFGTSLPELSVSVTASLEGDAGISVGNVVGSNIANVLLILGLAALVRPVAASAQITGRDAWVMVGASALLIALALDGSVGRLDAVVLLAAFTVYVYIFVGEARRQREETEPPPPAQRESPALPSVKTVGGLVIVLVSSAVLVASAIFVAESLSIPSELIGLSIVAVGTSLPELATSVVAARRGESDLSVGNVVGSNIFNALLIVGVAAAIRPLKVEAFMLPDMAIMLATALLLVPVLRSGLVVSRREGVLMLVCYGLYMTYVFTYGTAT